MVWTLLALLPVSTLAGMESQMLQNSRNRQNWPHIQQNCYQGHRRFQSSSTKPIHVKLIFSQGQDILNQADISLAFGFP